MPTLREIKGRISSVRSTLKITSAMKLVSSSKLRRAQNAIEAMRPYQRQLDGILQSLLAAGARIPESHVNPEAPLAVVAISSNTSLCGGFNSSVIAKVKDVLAGNPGAIVYSAGRKVADAMRKAGFASPLNLNDLSEKPSYAPVSELAGRLMEDFSEGRISGVVLVYSHFVSASRQIPVAEQLLPASSAHSVEGGETEENDAIVEPSAPEMMASLFPKSVKLKMFTAFLDSAASEHAARTVAMQTATDNGENLLSELTLIYNKTRQQRITTEILDLAGGKIEE